MNTKIHLQPGQPSEQQGEAIKMNQEQATQNSGAERQGIMEAWNNTAVAIPDTKCIHDLFEAQVARTPEHLAVIFEDQGLTYRELKERASQLAGQLRQQGVGPDVRVGICMTRSLAMVVGLYAIHKAGGAYVPLDPAYPAERLAFMLEDAQVPILLTEKALLPSLPPTSAVKLCLDDCACAEGDATRTTPVGRAAEPAHLAYVIYTSGSTGKPKGVMVEHRNVVNFFTGMDLALGREPGVWLAVTSISFDIHVLELFWTLTRGFTVVLQGDGASARRTGAKPGSPMADQILKHGVTHLQCTPSLAAMMLEEPGTRQALPRVRTLLFGGEPLPSSLLKQLGEGHEIFNLYGPTETTVWSTVHPVTRSGGIICIGRPIANTRIYILNESREPVPVGVAGELWIGGAGVVRGYLNRPELTAERFVPDPFSAQPGARMYRTGDLAQYNQDGTIHFLGRADQQVKIRGFRIELGEIESVLCDFPGVQAAVVSVWQPGPNDTRLVAYIIAQPGRTCETAELRRFLRGKLPEHMVPSVFLSLSEFPLTPNGKIDRKALPLPKAASSEALQDPVPSFPQEPPAQPAAGPILKTLPLTEAQREIWFGAQLSDEVSSSLNQSMVLNFQGKLDLARLKDAFEWLVQRHEGLRVTFAPSGETQRLHQTMLLEIPFEDLSTLSAAAARERLDFLLDQEATRPFDLTKGPLIRVQILKRSPQEHTMLLTLQHIICDGCSLAVLLEDLAKKYSAEDGASLAAVEMSYSQFVQAQEAALHEPERQEVERFWLEQYSVPVSAVELPLDRPRPVKPKFTGGSGRRLLSPELTQGVKRLSAQHRCTLMTTLLATYYLLLHRLSGQTDLVVGLPMTRRAGPGSENLVGHCVNFLPLRFTVNETFTFTQHLGEMWQLLMRAHEHHNYTLGSLLQKLNLGRHQSRVPLTTVMFNLDWVQEPLTISNLRVEVQPNPRCQVRFDLSFSVAEQDGRLELFVQYSSELLEHSTVERWLTHFETLLGAVVAHPSVLLKDLPQLRLPDGTIERRSDSPMPLQVDGVARPNADMSKPSAAPENPVEETIARIWQEVILLDKVGRHDNFFDVGGHSLLATKVVARIAKAFQVEVPVRTVFEAPTVAELAQAVSRARAAQPAPASISIPRNQPPEAEALLKKIEKLSEAELRALLMNLK